MNSKDLLKGLLGNWRALRLRVSFPGFYGFLSLWVQCLTTYSDLLLKSVRFTMHVSCLRVLYIEVFKKLKNIDPSFMHGIFKINSSIYSSRNPNDLQHYRPKQVTFGSNSLRSLGP